MENTVPAPIGARYAGREACVKLWEGIAVEPGTHFDIEEVFVAGERAIIRLRYWWGDGESNSVRGGVNLMRVRDRLIEKSWSFQHRPNSY